MSLEPMLTLAVFLFFAGLAIGLMVAPYVYRFK
jgi:hypothetical protein